MPKASGSMQEITELVEDFFGMFERCAGSVSGKGRPMLRIQGFWVGVMVGMWKVSGAAIPHDTCKPCTNVSDASD